MGMMPAMTTLVIFGRSRSVRMLVRVHRHDYSRYELVLCECLAQSFSFLARSVNRRRLTQTPYSSRIISEMILQSVARLSAPNEPWRNRCMKFPLIVSYLVTIVFAAASEPHLAYKDFTLVAGKPSPKGCYPELVRIEKSGRAVFRLQQDGPVIVRAAAGEQIPEGESDFYGFVLHVDVKRQTAVIRQYDLSKPL